MAKKAKDLGHLVLNAECEKIHEDNRQLDKYEDGSCLTGHEASMWKRDANDKPNLGKKTSGSTCNYRFQAIHRVKAGHRSGDTQKILYGYKTDKVANVDTSIVTKPGQNVPSNSKLYYRSTIPLPTRKNDWRVDGPEDFKYNNGYENVPKGANFYSQTWPYWNNAHHIIPKGTLKGTIMNSDHHEMIQRGLLDAKYNVNHHINLLLMPQDREVAAHIGILRHLQLKDEDGYMVSPQVGNHPEYNRIVEQKLNLIVNDFNKIVEEANTKADPEKHQVPKFTLAKKKLEKLSDKMFDWIVTNSKTSAGQSLDSAANEFGLDGEFPSAAAAAAAAATATAAAAAAAAAATGSAPSDSQGRRGRKRKRGD